LWKLGYFCLRSVRLRKDKADLLDINSNPAKNTRQSVPSGDLRGREFPTHKDFNGRRANTTAAHDLFPYSYRDNILSGGGTDRAACYILCCHTTGRQETH
jgi:hypothetical protein